MSSGGLARSFRGRNAIFNVFEVWVALSGIMTGVVYVINKKSLDQNSVGIIVGYHLALVWCAMYGISGLYILYGLLRPSPRAEIMGLSLLAGATAVNGIAVFYVFNLRGFSVGSTFLTLSVAAWTRSVFVYVRAQQLATEGSSAPTR